MQDNQQNEDFKSVIQHQLQITDVFIFLDEQLLLLLMLLINFYLL